MISHIASGFDVQPLVDQIEAHPDIWNRHTLRKDQYHSPHQEMSDIWVRFRDWKDYSGDAYAFTQTKHESVWYPAADEIPAVRELARQVLEHVDCDVLGGILITRVPSGGMIAPHIDTGWHAATYAKYAVQLKGNADQGFYFDDSELHPLPGDLYTFDNSKTHWVLNPTLTDRMTLIICARKDHDYS